MGLKESGLRGSLRSVSTGVGIPGSGLYPILQTLDKDKQIDSQLEEVD